MSDIKSYSFPTHIKAGPGASSLLGEALKAEYIQRPLLVTDRDLAKLPPVQRVRRVLETACDQVALFDGLWGNPLVSQVEAGVARLKSAKADGIVAVGGGAAMDVAKCIALMAHHPGEILNYIDGDPEALPVDQDLPFLVAVPTTAGTGSEVGRSAVVSEDASRAKKIIFSPRLLPRRVFLDAELSLGLPAGVTAATGMDALTHLIEAYIAKGVHPMCDGIALEGVRLVASSLPQAVAFAQESAGASEQHLLARDMMLHAAMMGAVAFQKGLGVTHSCAHALSTVCDLHHGLANGVLLPTTMRFNLPACGERFAMLARMVGLEGTPDAWVGWGRCLRSVHRHAQESEGGRSGP